MTFHIFFLLPLVARCLGQENPCEGISLGSCFVEPGSIINELSFPPEKCAKFCQLDNNCEFWRAREDGTLCHLLSSDYQHDCESFAGAINWLDCTEGPDSCYAYVGDDCVYNGERIEEDEPVPGNVASIEECRLWAELCMDDGVAFFHYNSVTEECHLYRTLDAECQSVGGPKSAPDFDECTATTTTTTTTPTTTTGVKCPEGWTLEGQSCYFLSTEIVKPFSAAVAFCENLGSTLVEINTEAENAFVVAMAEQALAIDNHIGRDYWMGGVKTGDGTWMWQSGDPMEFTNWCEACPDTEGWDCSQLLKDGYPGRLDTYYWARNTFEGVDDGVICEINLDK